MWTSNEQGISKPLRDPPHGGARKLLDASLLLRMMDEVDHGMLVIDAQGAVAPRQPPGPL